MFPHSGPVKKKLQMARRSVAEDLKFIEKIDDVTYVVRKGFVPGMRTEAKFFVSQIFHTYLQQGERCSEGSGF